MRERQVPPQVQIGAIAVVMSAHARFPGLFPPTGGVAVLAGYALATVAVAVAMLMTERRDA